MAQNINDFDKDDNGLDLPCVPLPLQKLQNKREITKIHNRHHPGISPFITAIIRLSKMHSNINFIKNGVRV